VPRLMKCLPLASRGSRGITVAEMLVVLLIAGILLTGAAPFYLGYTQQARTVEARAVAVTLWTAVASHAIAACGTPVTVSGAAGSAGFDADGVTAPPRWRIAAGADRRLTVDCASGAFALAGEVFSIEGVAADVSAIRVSLGYAPASTPPARLRCSTNGGAVWVDC